MITRIEVEGIDKTGKDLIAGYIDRLSNRRYLVHARGLLSMITYSKVYERNYDYSKEIEDNKHTLIVYLDADIEDLKIRHELSNESKIDIYRDAKAFNDSLEMLTRSGITIVRKNTSKETPYMIAKAVLDFVDSVNRLEEKK